MRFIQKEIFVQNPVGVSFLSKKSEICGESKKRPFFLFVQNMHKPQYLVFCKKKIPIFCYFSY